MIISNYYSKYGDIFTSYRLLGTYANSADPVQLPQNEASDHVSHRKK